ncbi:MAG: DNA polymerase III subunit delta [Eubacteriales bacterium]|nr:DNA polymerase III subunit delta [Eubacteriales bacterium]
MRETKADFIRRQKQLNDEIAAHSFAQAYLVYGAQAYLRLQNRDKIRSALLGDGDAMNITTFTGKDVSAREVIDLAETLPFFAERRVIVLEDTELFGGAEEEAQLLADYLGTQPETTFFLFVQAEVDKRKKLYKAIEKAGRVLECDALDEGTLRSWTRGIFQREKLAIDGPALALFLQYAGEDMQNIREEAEKLICLCMGEGEVTAERIRSICSPRIRDRIFEMIEAIARRDGRHALLIYMEMSALQTPPQVILSLLQRQYNQLLQVKEMAAKGYADGQIASALKLPPFVISKKYRPCLAGYTTEALRRSLERCVQADADYKSGRIAANIAAEMVIVEGASS